MKKLPIALFSVATIVTGWIAFAGWYGSKAYAVGRVPVVHLPFDSSSIYLQIRNNERAVKQDPKSALGLSLLSSAYLDRSRESDDTVTAVKAEIAARRSLEIRKLGNIGARNKLVQSLLQQHRFKDALKECQIAENIGVFSDDTTVLKAECLIELGQYDDAKKLFARTPRAFKDGSAKSVVARLLDIEGKPLEALAILRSVTAEVEMNGGMPSNAVAWFHTRLAMQLAKLGHHTEGKAEYLKALKLYPRNYKAMAGLAKIASQDGHWREVIEWGIQSDKIAQMADVRALVGDAYAMLGDPGKAEAQYAGVAALVGRPSGMNDGMHEVTSAAGLHGHRLDRQYAIFCADHDRDLAGAYAAAIRDFEARKDIYAYDTLAWVCYKKGDRDEAIKAIRIALGRGTRDPMLWFHAGEIFLNSGDRKHGINCLRKSLEIDPHFDGVAAGMAIRELNERKPAGTQS